MKQYKTPVIYVGDIVEVFESRFNSWDEAIPAMTQYEPVTFRGFRFRVYSIEPPCIGRPFPLIRFTDGTSYQDFDKLLIYYSPFINRLKRLFNISNI